MGYSESCKTFHDFNIVLVDTVDQKISNIQNTLDPLEKPTYEEYKQLGMFNKNAIMFSKFNSAIL